MKFIYTEAALQELQAFQHRQQKLLEDLISDRKFVFGDETVEVTASDIREAAEHIRAYRPRTARYPSYRLVSQVYIFLGFGITLGAIFYPTLENIFQENRVQAMALITGVIMIAIGVFAGYWSRLRARREEELERMRSLLSDKDRT